MLRPAGPQILLSTETMCRFIFIETNLYSTTENTKFRGMTTTQELRETTPSQR